VHVVVADGLESFEVHVAPLELPLVVLLKQERSPTSRTITALGKMPTTSVRRSNAAKLTPAHQ
jgi:hypothetical protein